MVIVLFCIEDVVKVSQTAGIKVKVTPEPTGILKWDWVQGKHLRVFSQLHILNYSLESKSLFEVAGPRLGTTLYQTKSESPHKKWNCHGNCYQEIVFASEVGFPLYPENSTFVLHNDSAAHSKRFEPGISVPVVWCATKESPHFRLSKLYDWFLGQIYVLYTVQ